MTNTKRILNYAYEMGGQFTRKGLLKYLISQEGKIREKSIDTQLNRLIVTGSVQRIGHGKYMLTNNCLPKFLYYPSQLEKNLYAELKKQFPLLDFCIWSPKVLSSLMLHIPDIDYTFVDVEKDGMEPVFHFLQSMDIGVNILISPSETDCERYLTGTSSIVVRQLIGRSPVTRFENCTVPLIEKILTDAVGDNELMFAGGSEIYNIFENAFERYSINQSKMRTYASRRNRQKKVEQILNTLGYDKS